MVTLLFVHLVNFTTTLYDIKHIIISASTLVTSIAILISIPNSRTLSIYLSSSDGSSYSLVLWFDSLSITYALMIPL